MAQGLTSDGGLWQRAHLLPASLPTFSRTWEPCVQASVASGRAAPPAELGTARGGHRAPRESSRHPWHLPFRKGALSWLMPLPGLASRRSPGQNQARLGAISHLTSLSESPLGEMSHLSPRSGHCGCGNEQGFSTRPWGKSSPLSQRGIPCCQLPHEGGRSAPLGTSRKPSDTLEILKDPLELASRMRF